MSPPSKRWDEALPLGEPCAASSQADFLSSIATNTAASQADGICSICRIDQLPSGPEEPKSDPITGQLHGTFARTAISVAGVSDAGTFSDPERSGKASWPSLRRQGATRFRARLMRSAADP